MAFFTSTPKDKADKHAAGSSSCPIMINSSESEGETTVQGNISQLLFSSPPESPEGSGINEDPTPPGSDGLGCSSGSSGISGIWKLDSTDSDTDKESTIGKTPQAPKM